MKIGVISDTHLHEPDQGLLQLTQTVFREVQMVLHAGDLTHLAVLEAFADKDVVAVSGNMDGLEVNRRLKEKEVIQAGGFRIGLIHGWGSGRGLEERVRKRFQGVDAIVYGHSHQASNHVEGDVLMFNPGAYAGSLFFHSGRSVGILHIGDAGIKGEILPL